MTRLAILALTLVAGCPPPAPVPPGPDASDAAPMPAVDASPAPTPDAGPPDACTRACANLRALSCPEGADALACLDACRAADGKLTQLAPACVGAASSAAGVRACAPAWGKACQADAGLLGALDAFGAWDKSGAPPRRTPDGGCDERCQHDQAVRDMQRLMNSGF